MYDIIFYIFMVYLCIDNVSYVYVIHEYYTTNKKLCIFALNIYFYIYTVPKKLKCIKKQKPNTSFRMSMYKVC